MLPPTRRRERGSDKSAVLGALASMLVLATCMIPHEMREVGPSPGCRSAASSANAGLTWYGPTAARDVELHRSWCETVAAPIILPTPDGPHSPWRSADSLTVVAWNIYVGGGDLLGFLRTELGVDCTRVVPTLRPDSSPFVILIQEAYRRAPFLLPVGEGPLIPWRIDPEPRPGASLDIEGVARRCGLALVYVPAARNGPDLEGRAPEDIGNAILSSVPLSDLIAIELPFEAGRKVAVGAVVRAPNGEDLRFVSVHLDVASTLYRTLITGNGTRLRQVSGLTEALERSTAAATVVGGDFNTWSVRESALVHMERRFPELHRDGRATRGGFPADHIFLARAAGGGLEVVPGSYSLLNDMHLSDHKARVVRIRTVGAAAPPGR